MATDMTPQELAEAAAAAVFGRGSSPFRAVTETDQIVARAFGREVPELREAAELPATVSESARKPVSERDLADLLERYRTLRVSRLGESAKSVDALVAAEEALISDVVTEGGQRVRRVRNFQRLAELRDKVVSLEAQVPLSASADPAPARREEVTVQEADASVARAFGRVVGGGA
ncbi:hypothetical protein [Janibacter indicus]|uniref:hypothetical protein n=1 Tax=Janibacter indicus TaxID=857417 RepID=UPI003D9AB1AA